MPTILIADDEKNIRATLTRALRLEGYATLEAESGAQALEHLLGGGVDLLILDLQMPVLDGLGLLQKMADSGSRVPVVVLTAHGTIEKAVKAVRLGAFDFIEKPPAVERILLAVENALRVERLLAENHRLVEEAGIGAGILGASPPMQALAEILRKVAPTEAGVLLLGENGTGKEVVARAIHAASPRRGRPLVTVNCAAIPETLVESELFGHARGAFTGATEARRGKFQQADGGTLFLDEVGEIPLALQPKMLRALESGEVERIGGGACERVDVRVIAATNRDLAAEVAAGRFRQDLYYRLLVVPVRVPALRERREDIALLARHFFEAACRRNRARPRELSAAAVAALERYDWPGNVRELRNAMERVAILVPDASVGAEHLDFLGAGALGVGPFPGATPAGATPAALPLADELRRHERDIILNVLERNRWRMSKAARELNLERSHLYKKIKSLKIERPPED
jgi:DNA-binding NtrC family response regulator